MKEYELLKNKGTWTEVERRKFETAFRLYGKNWGRIAAVVGTRTLAQVRSHGQKIIPKILSKHKLTPKADNQLPQIALNNSNAPSIELGKKWVYHATVSAYILCYSLFLNSNDKKNLDTNAENQQAEEEDF